MAASIFNGTAVKLLKNILKFKGGASIDASSAGTSVATLPNKSITIAGTQDIPTKNYMLNPDAEVDTTGWATYADAAGTSPVDGTGGSSNSTWTRSTSSPLRGSASFLFTHNSGASRQGEGASYAFTIDTSDKAKVLNISFDYLVNSGTFTAGASGVDSDLTVWVYDVTNAVLIQPSSYKLLSNSSTIADKFNATFQTASNSTSYRLIIHCGSTSTSAFTAQFDNFNIGPSNYVYGTPFTDLQTVTAVASSWTTNTTTTTKVARNGDHAIIEWNLALTGAPNNTSLLCNFPAGLQIDTNKLTGSQTSYFLEGKAWGNRSTAAVDLEVIYNSTTAVNVVYLSSVTTAGVTQLSTTAPVTWASGDNITVRVRVPILGWSSSIQMSDQTDTRIVDMYATKTASQAITANVTDITFTSSKDSHGAWSGSVFTVPVAGDYLVSASMADAGTSTGSIYPYVNGTQGAQRILVIYSGNFGQGTILIPGLKTGDTVSFRNNSTTTMGGAGFISFVRLSGPSAIAATESVQCKYKNTAGTSLSAALATIPFATKAYDTHGAYNTSTGVFTAPISGKYRVTIRATTAAVSNSTSQLFEAHIKVTSTPEGLSAADSFLDARRGNGASANQYINCSAEYDLVAGNTLEVQLANGLSTTLSTNAEFNVISIARIGN